MSMVEEIDCGGFIIQKLSNGRTLLYPPHGWLLELESLVERGIIAKSSAPKIIAEWYKWARKCL